MHPALLVEDLSVSLRGRALVDGVSFTLAPGERLALLGASGSGKSLTAAALLGQLPAAMRASGRLEINGKEVDPGKRRIGGTGIAAIHQDPQKALNPLVPLGRQLGIPLLHAGLSATEARRQALELLVSVGLEEAGRIMSSFSGELSGGQLQRVCIALALACRNPVMIADEPTTALDAVSQAKVLDALSRYSESSGAMLFITHDLAVAAALCRHAMVLASGRVVEQGSMDSLVQRPRHGYTRRLVEAAHGNPDSLRQEAKA